MTEIEPAKVFILAVSAGALITALAVKPWKALYLRRGWVDHPGPRKIHAEATALAGGAAVLTGFLMALLVGGVVLLLMQSSMSERADIGVRELFGVVFGAIAIFLLGFWDDVRDLSPRVKFCGQLLVVAVTVGCGIR